MASVYEKAGYWYGKVKMGREHKGIALGMPWAEGTKMAAKRRANDLESEIRAGALSDRSREFLTEMAAAKILGFIGHARIKLEPGSPTTWRAAYQAYLQATDAKDTRAPVPGKAKVEEKTKVTRRYKLRQFVLWAEANQVPFMKVPFTQTIVDYIEWRRSQGIRASTLYSGDWTLLRRWGTWMAGRHLCLPLDMTRIAEAMPAKDAVIISVPTWKEDLDSLRFLSGLRLTDSTRGYQWKHNRCYFPAWSLMLVVRGLGCRPSEATALTWGSVHFGPERFFVEFLHSKNKRHRKVPILYQWVLDGLREIWERQGGPAKSEAVCRKWDGGIWTHDTAAANLIQRVFEHHGREVYQLKKAQKMYITQLLHAGFAPFIVADWTDHSLAVQEQFYNPGDGYMAPDRSIDYGEYGVFSAFGEMTRVHQAAFTQGRSR